MSDDPGSTSANTPQKHKLTRTHGWYITIGILLLVAMIIGSTSSKPKNTAHKSKDSQVQQSASNPTPSSTPITVSNTPASTPAATTTPAPTPAPAAPSCYTAAQSWNEIGQTGCVTFTGYAYTSDRGEMYLDQDSSDYTDGFSVWIPAGESFGSSVLSQYSGVPINVSGTITQYDGAPEIEVTSASQITAVQ